MSNPAPMTVPESPAARALATAARSPASASSTALARSDDRAEVRRVPRRMGRWRDRVQRSYLLEGAWHNLHL